MVDRGGLENRCTRERTVGSNPTLSANNHSVAITDGYNFIPPIEYQRLEPVTQCKASGREPWSRILNTAKRHR